MLAPSMNGGYSIPETDRLHQLKAFDESKLGVKGIVDAGVTKIPKIFIQESDGVNLHELDRANRNTQLTLPVIDLEGINEDPIKRRKVVDEVRDASETWGFFQVVNHGIPIAILEEMLAGVRRFNEQDSEVKKQYYSRDFSKKVLFNSNFDLYSSSAANWRDSFYCTMAPNPPEPEVLPVVCREIMIEYSRYIMNLAHCLFKILSEGLRLSPNHLIEMGCADALAQICHYYPVCPEPESTNGTTRHSDNDFMTLLLQDNIGGLQVLHQNQWVDVPPTPGALVVNHGDLIQLISNDKFRSVEHRVLASHKGPRISVASFFGRDSGLNDKLYAPIQELISEDNPAKYRATTLTQYTEFYRKKGLGGTSALLHFRL